VIQKPAPEREPIDYGFMLLTFMALGPFILAWSIFGCACVIKAARLLYDVAVSWGAA
jgi:hypothetical protein